MNNTSDHPPAGPCHQSCQLPAGAIPAAHPRLYLLAVLLCVGVGIFLRLWPSGGFTKAGFDEVLYHDYAQKVDRFGIWNYPAICQVYLEQQRKQDSAVELPPTRLLYIVCGALWKSTVFGDAPSLSFNSPEFVAKDPFLRSLRSVSALAGVLLMLAGGAFAARMHGKAAALGVLALLSVSPLQLHMSQHAFIDGFFALFALLALWTFWENLRHPNHPKWLCGLGLALMLLVLTKENAFFVCVGLGGLLAVNRWAQFGTVTPKLLLVMLLGPLAGLVLLLSAAGGPAALFEIYTLLVNKAQASAFAVRTGDGPWQRYLIDLMVLSPSVFCLAAASAFSSARKDRAVLFLSGFIVFSYLLMCNVRYGMNLRYATIWDAPLRCLAVVQISLLTSRLSRVGRAQAMAAILAVGVLCVLDLRQYGIFFEAARLYELDSESLFRAVLILK